MNTRLIHDAAFRMAGELLAIIAPCLRPEEQRDCWEEFYTVAKRFLTEYEEQAARLRRRLGGLGTDAGTLEA